MPNAEYLCLQNDTFPRLPCDACHHVCLICSFHWRLVIRKTVLTRLENLLKLRGKFQRNHSDAQYLIQLMLYSDFLFQKQELSHGLSDEVFVISRIIKVEVSVISRSRRLRLITLTRFHLSLPSFKSLFGSLVEVVLSCREFISPVLLTFKTTLQ